MSRRGERAVVPHADFQSYYGKPVIKQPTWKVPDIPMYLFLGGLAGASSAMGVLAEATRRPQLARVAILSAAAAAAGGTGFLINDLGRPTRFLNMLRVLKPTSPLSVGSWLLAAYDVLAGSAAALSVTGLLPGPARLAKAGAGLLGPAMMTYTAVLVADTAVPAWHDAYRELPFLFAGSSLLAGAGVGMLAAPPRQTGPARIVAAAGAGLELLAEQRMSARLGLVAEPYHHGRSGRWMRAGKLLAAVGAVAALASRGSRPAAVASGAALVAGSLCTRLGVLEAGRASAGDPRYTVVPQRERLAAARAAASNGASGTGGGGH